MGGRFAGRQPRSIGRMQPRFSDIECGSVSGHGFSRAEGPGIVITSGLKSARDLLVSSLKGSGFVRAVGVSPAANVLG